MQLYSVTYTAFTLQVQANLENTYSCDAQMDLL